MDRLISGNKTFEQYEYLTEDEFERRVVEFSSEIFGPRSAYIDVKKKIGGEIKSIPDGYLIDFSFSADPRLYIIENELVRHDPYRHIGQQLLRFSISYRASGRKIKTFLLNHILGNEKMRALVEDGLKAASYRNIDVLLEDLIFEKPVAAIVIIDQSSSELENVLSQLTMKADVIEFQTYYCDSEQIHKFTPFQQEVRSITETSKPRIKVEDIDTIVVPANEDGFKAVFLDENRWYAIRISSAMLERIKYIAVYQTAPISAVTYVAEVAKIQKYKDTAKYEVVFKERAQNIGPIKQPKGENIAPQAPRYTTYKRLLKAKTMDQIF